MTIKLTDRETLVRLADAYGVASEYWGYDGEKRTVEDSTVVKVLEAMGVGDVTDENAEYEIWKRNNRDWYSVLPEFTVARDDRSTPLRVHVPDGYGVEVKILFEKGGETALQQIEDNTPAREIEGRLIGQAAFLIPAGMPLGYHRLFAAVTDFDGRTEEFYTCLALVPNRIDAAYRGPRAWGMMAQLYSVRSRDSWGIGDLNDLSEMGSVFGDFGADFLLINPLHAAEPVGKMTPSPYLPVTRRFFNPIYIRPENIRETAYLSGPQRSLVVWAGEKVKELSTQNTLIDRDAVWDAKREALDVIYQAGRSEARQRAFERFRETEGEGLENFALWCAINEAHGGKVPARLRDLHSPAVNRERSKLAGRIDFWAWLQWILDEQLAEAQKTALASGMRYGICHDLAVGVHPNGSDTWSNPDAFAKGIGVGAPPDMYNQQGQDWSQPPMQPVMLPALGYAPLRDMARTVLRHAGMLRVDHVMGLFRLWWIPTGNTPDRGTYVKFDHEAMVGILLLEAARVGAILIGEDLGTIEPWVGEYLKERGILGTSIFWFEKNEDGTPKYADKYRDNVLATVDTHDLPPAAGYLAGEHVDLRARLGLLVEDEAKVRREAETEREQVLARLKEYGLLGEDASEREIIEALHAYIAQTPARLLGVSLVDAVGERRAQNQPGTDTEYPNWKVPLADGTEKIVLVEDLPKHPRVVSLMHSFSAALNR